MRQLDGITESMDMNLGKFWDLVMDSDIYKYLFLMPSRRPVGFRRTRALVPTHTSQASWGQTGRGGPPGATGMHCPGRS